MKKTTFLLFALLLFCSCNNKEKQLNKAIDKAVACAELGTVEYTVTKLIITNDNDFYKLGDRKIIFSCRTTMKAGIDLKDFTKEFQKVTICYRLMIPFFTSPVNPQFLLKMMVSVGFESFLPDRGNYSSCTMT